MNLKHSLAVILALGLLSACDSSHRPTYSGKQESTEGVPGFVNGKKVSPHIKLGQSYTVDGETYVPRNQPDYVEEGMASWYGPGFHGGKTANGEQFDSAELTAAHRTLPLPSIVRVTLLSTGKQVFVRVNDRGPFAHSRIIDLSRGAADKIGLLRAGVGKVRVEYMKDESQRFTDLLGQGRDPKSIDLASEVLNYGQGGTNYARGDVRLPEQQVASAASGRQPSPSFWNNLNPAGNAYAGEPQMTDSRTVNAAPVSDVATADLGAAGSASKPVAAVSAPKPAAAAEPVEEEDNSPFAAVDKPDAAPPPREMEVASVQASPPPQAATADTVEVDTGERFYVQLGAFQNAENANRLRGRYADIGDIAVTQKANGLYHVRMGPYPGPAQVSSALDKLKAVGGEGRIVHE